MQLENYVIKNGSGISFTREQASHFAKDIAGDFNPLHDADGKLFCVPGDLLFAIALNHYGLSRHMRFVFSGMVGDETALRLPGGDAAHLVFTDDDGREYLSIERSGECSREPDQIRDLTCGYVTFSGKAFPDILVPLMRRHDTMINPGRPLVIYESMEIDLEHLAFSSPELRLSDSVFEINGKKGDIRLGFDVVCNGETVGRGAKYMLVRGLRPFDEAQMSALVEQYAGRKETYAATTL
ncbi:MAG: DUF3581 domain-containing protein [gamma proteobacterium symbiont of Phacoides pectinatus]